MDGEQQRAGTSTLTTRLALRAVADRLGPPGIERLLDRAGLEGQQWLLESSTGRVDYQTKLRVFAAAAELLDDPRFGLDLGFYALHDPAFKAIGALALAAGSPERVLRYGSRISTRFDSAAVFRCERSDMDSAVVVWRVLAPHEPSRTDCDYTISMLRLVPLLFGGRPAAVRHTVCQLDGAPECWYEVTWQRAGTLRGLRSRWHGRRRAARRAAVAEAGDFEAKLAALQAAAADITGGGELEDVLDRVASRANAALHAPGHVLAVRLPSGDRHVRFRGEARVFEGAVTELERLGAGVHAVADHPVVTAPVASAANHYGVLAAVAHPGQDFFATDVETLSAYARHAAASLDMSTQLLRAAQEAQTARLLLDVSRSLSHRRTVESVAEAVAAAVRPLCGAPRSAFALVDPTTGGVTVAGASGWPEDLTRAVLAYSTTPAESPELFAMLRSASPVLLDATGSPWAQALLRDFAVEALVAVPVLLEGKVLGLVLASWLTDGPERLDAVMVERLTGLAGLAAVALDNARLLEQVRRQALHDPLTELPNRLLLERRLEQALEAARDGAGPVGLLFCDVDRFKRVNDTLGHNAGDQLLRHVAAVLRASVGDPATVARYSGDEFVVLLPRVRGEDEVRETISRIRIAMGERMTASGEHVVLSMAIGMAVSDGYAEGAHGREPETAASLVARADREMYQLKARARGTRAPDTGIDRLRLETELQGAAARGELVVHYQPQIDVRTGETVAVEALVRWQHPQLGLVAPSLFIPIAEECGAIAEIGTYVLQEACRAVSGWDAATDLEVAVNVSAAQLQSGDFARSVRAILAETGLPAGRLVLEVTESQVVADDASEDQLRDLRALGVGISVDDFGTGYSSLAQLRRLPATEVKIDRSFTAQLPGSQAFIAGVIALAHGLGLRVVAEGVESAEQLRALSDASCDRAQGYLFGRPAPAGRHPDRPVRLPA